MRSHKIKIFKLLIVFFTLLYVNCVQRGERIKNAREFIKTWDYDRALTEIISYRNTKDAELQYLLGYCYLMKNEFKGAAEYFMNSLAISSTFKDSIFKLYDNLAQNALKIREPQRALFLYAEIVKLIPEHAPTNNLFLLGDLNFDQGNYPSAITAYTAALRIDSISPKAKESQHKLIKALTECDSLNLALRLATAEYEKLKTADNLLQLTEIKFTLGKKLFDSDRLDSARIFFEQIVAGQEPKSVLDDAYFYLGEISLNKHMFEQALESYTNVLRLNPYEKGEIIKKTKDRIQEIKERK